MGSRLYSYQNKQGNQFELCCRVRIIFAIVLGRMMDPLSGVLSLLKPRTYMAGALDAGGKVAVQFPPALSEGQPLFVGIPAARP